MRKICGVFVVYKICTSHFAWSRVLCMRLVMCSPAWLIILHASVRCHQIKVEVIPACYQLFQKYWLIGY